MYDIKGLECEEYKAGYVTENHIYFGHDWHFQRTLANFCNDEEYRNHRVQTSLMYQQVNPCWA